MAPDTGNINSSLTMAARVMALDLGRVCPPQDKYLPSTRPRAIHTPVSTDAIDDETERDRIIAQRWG